MNNNDMDYWNSKGTALIKSGKYEKAITCFNKALKIDSNNVDLLYNKAHVLHILGRYKEAIKYLNKALRIDENNIDVLYNKGVSLYKLGKYEQAVKSYDKALKVSNKEDDILSMKGLALHYLCRYDEAIECYDEALKLNPILEKEQNNLNNKGLSLLCAGKFREAIDVYNKVLEINDEYIGVWYNKGAAFHNLQEYEKAVECYEKELKINNMDANAWYSLGITLTILNKQELAKKCFKESLKIDPSNKTVLDALSNINTITDINTTDINTKEDIIKDAFKMTKGKCCYCNRLISKSGMNRHLNACKERKKYFDKILSDTKIKKGKFFHLIVTCEGLPMYWLHLGVNVNNTLKSIDNFLRDIWVECCGHLSRFIINNLYFESHNEFFDDCNNDQKSMNRKLKDVLETGMKIIYDYDYGSTTRLTIKVLNEYQDKNSKNIKIISRNEPPDLKCIECGKPATKVCSICLMDGYYGFICDTCAKTHECGDDYFLPNVNSPRVGICGYTGEKY